MEAIVKTTNRLVHIYTVVAPLNNTRNSTNDCFFTAVNHNTDPEKKEANKVDENLLITIHGLDLLNLMR